jgi:nucleoside-diphosphate-sugar epimerase
MLTAIAQEDLARIVSAPLPWQNLAGKTVLVTGANGFLPAYLVESFLLANQKYGLGLKVLGLVRNAERAKKRFGHHVERNDLSFVVQDVTKPLSTDEKIHVIIHAASQASPKYYGVDPVGTLAANTLGTANMLEAARRNQVERFLYFSTSEVYGRDPGTVPTEEKSYGYLDPTDVRSCYAEGKRAGETMCVSWKHQYGVPSVIVRPFHTYGPGMDLSDGRVFADFVNDVVNGRDIVMMSDGLAQRAFCYLADATLGFLTVLLRGAAGEAYNIGNDRAEISIVELAELLVGLFPDKGLRVVRKAAAPNSGYLPSQVMRNCPDIAKAKALGWEPTTSLEEGFSRTIRSFL